MKNPAARGSKRKWSADALPVMPELAVLLHGRVQRYGLVNELARLEKFFGLKFFSGRHLEHGGCERQKALSVVAKPYALSESSMHAYQHAWGKYAERAGKRC